MIANFFSWRRWCGGAVLAAVALGLGVSSSAGAGAVRILRPERSISVLSTSPAAGPKGVWTVDNAAFDETLAYDDTGDGYVSRSRANVTSTAIGEDGFGFTGGLSYAVQDSRPVASAPDDAEPIRAAVNFLYSVEFAVDNPVHYAIDRTDRALVNDAQTLRDDVVFGIYESGLNLLDTGAPTERKQFAGVLNPGTYWFAWGDGFDAVVADGTLRELSHDYALSVSFASVVVDDDNGKPHAIPLPPAAWSGLFVLGIVALNCLRKRRVV